jgi:RNA-directed DNA polymerase
MDVHVQRVVPISYEMVAKAYQKVKQGGKASGIDGQSWKGFQDQGVEKQLYVIWNRLSSGSYHPQPLREIEIPKKNGKKRKLGIPTLRDRIAQEVIRAYMEKQIDHQFHENSYGYRPLKSSHEAVEQVRKNCLARDWVVEMDISKFFDEIDHELMLRAVEHVYEERWVKMYVKRWLEMKIERADGSQYDRKGKGTPQGGVISPLLANLFLHFGLDKWLEKHYPSIWFVRYADDVVLHCSGKEEAEMIRQKMKERLAEINLSVNEEKTRIVYCKDYRRKEDHEQVQFGFLGFSFQPRQAHSAAQPGTSFTTFTPEMSRDNQKKIRQTIREIVGKWSRSRELSNMAILLNDKIRGWINYFGRYGKRALRRTLVFLDRKLACWLRRKHKCGRRQAFQLLLQSFHRHPKLFYHWYAGYTLLVRN